MVIILVKNENYDYQGKKKKQQNKKQTVYHKEVTHFTRKKQVCFHHVLVFKQHVAKARGK